MRLSDCCETLVCYKFMRPIVELHQTVEDLFVTIEIVIFWQICSAHFAYSHHPFLSQYVCVYEYVCMCVCFHLNINHERGL